MGLLKEKGAEVVGGAEGLLKEKDGAPVGAKLLKPNGALVAGFEVEARPGKLKAGLEAAGAALGGGKENGVGGFSWFGA